MTLGFASVCKFYLRRHDFFNKNLRLDFLRYVKYYPVEKRIIKSYDKVIVVSEHDAEYLRNKFRVNNIITISNGADIPKTHPVAKRPFNYSIGILSYWGAGAEQDTSWFILDYLPKLKKHFPELKLVTAGRGASPETITFLEDHGVKHLGEVDTLDMFFNEIDIYITTLRKECGILNKVLDAFAYKKIVLGLEHNMYAFKNLKNGYLTWSTFDELVKAITFIHDNQDLVWEMEDNAFVYIVKHHSWEKNYAILKSMIRQYSTT
jgi:glycosyltransferase involved in cell wall biosynthesis